VSIGKTVLVNQSIGVKTGGNQLIKEGQRERFL